MKIDPKVFKEIIENGKAVPNHVGGTVIHHIKDDKYYHLTITSESSLCLRIRDLNNLQSKDIF